MAYDETVADRVAAALERLPLLPNESIGTLRMFGGLCFTLNGKMVAGITQTRLMVRMDADAFACAQAAGLATPMDFTGKPLRNFAYLNSEAYASEDALLRWIEGSVRYVRENVTRK